ncbi:MAG: MFS transporter, partial [Terriglobales bacterium]
MNPENPSSTRAPELNPAAGGEPAANDSGGAFQSVCAEETIAAQVAPATVEMPRVLRALRHHDFRYFWAGNLLSNVGTWMQNVAQGWLVLELSNSAFWLGVVGFAASAPMLVFTLLGGVIADRVDRRRLMIRTQVAMMLFAFALAGLTWAKVINVPEILLLAFATGVAMSLNAPSYQALVPQLVPKEDLNNAIALNSAQFNFSRVVGPTLGGFAMAWLGVAGNFFLNGASFLAVIFALRRIHYPPPEPDDGSATMWQKLADGFRYVYDRREMTTLITLVGLASTFGIPYLMFIPLFARDILHVRETGLGRLMAFSGLGAFFGAGTIAYLGRVKRRGRFVVSAAVVFFVAIILFTFSRSFALSSALLMVVGY